MTKRLSQQAIGRGIGRYLDEIDAGFSGYVVFGRGVGSSNPDEIHAYADKIAAKREEEPSSLKRVKLLQRERDLRSAAEAIRARSESALEEHFVTYAADWATRNGIDYGTLREAGVSAEILRAAGIEQ